MSTKVITMSVWGNTPMYTTGAIRNSEIKNEILPDWEIWVYHDNTVPQDILNTLESNGCKLILPELNNQNMFWRFYPASDTTIERFIVRDSDSRLSLRDVSALEDWEQSDKKFHIVREHPVGHAWPLCGGMWGCLGGAIPDINHLINEYLGGRGDLHAPQHAGGRELDQYFLRDVIYPQYAQHSSFVHDEYTPLKEPHAIPIKRDLELDEFAFIGEAMDENDNDRWEREPGEQRAGIKSYYYAK